MNGEDLLIKLDENEIACSTGSACSANKKQKASHVLKALGISHQEVTGSIRFSMGHQNTREEMETTITRLKEIIAELRVLSEFDFDVKDTIRRMTDAVTKVIFRFTIIVDNKMIIPNNKANIFNICS